MQKSKFLEVLKTFSKKDYQKFGQFVNSDYFNTRIMLRKLYEVILNYSKRSEEIITREYLFKELYPGKKYREGTIVNLLSGLYKLFETYVNQVSFESESFTKESYLLKGLSSRKLDKFAFKTYRDTVKEMEKTSIRDADYFHCRHELEYQYMTFLSGNERGYNTLDKETIQNYYNRLVEYIIVRLLTVYAFMLNQKTYVREENFDMSFIELVFNYLHEKSFNHIPAISIYFTLIKLIIEDDAKHCYKLMDLLSRHHAILGSNERRNLYVNMLNFFTFKARVSGISKFNKESFELFKFIIENKIYITEANTKLDHILYLGTVETGLNVGEFEWVENFINRGREELLEEHRENTFNLCYAIFYFNKKNYNKSLEYLGRVQRMHGFFNLQINTLTLQNYYELNLYNNSFSLIDSYKHYLRENKEITNFNKDRAKDFLNTVNKLLKIKCRKHKFDASEFDLSREEFKNILKKKWIIEKIEEIQKI